MSRYNGDYGQRGPPAERWTPERFQRERGGRGSRVIERDHFEERDSYPNAGSRRRESSADEFHSRRPTRGGGRERSEDDRFFEREERLPHDAPVEQELEGIGDTTKKTRRSTALWTTNLAEASEREDTKTTDASVEEGDHHQHLALEC